MVKDNLSGAVVKSQKQNDTVETAREEPDGPAERAVNSARGQPELREPAETQLNLLLWSKLNLGEELECPNENLCELDWLRLHMPVLVKRRKYFLSWRHVPEHANYIVVRCCKPLTGAEADALPTHLRSFSSAEEYRLVKRTYQQLQHGGYYWGPMTMEDAHAVLSQAPLGTFLIRDSGQSDVFFTLSYQSDDGPTSVRVHLKNLLFSLCGSHRTFPSFFALLTHYTASACKLTVPYRKQRPERLKQMCRRAFVRTRGAENIRTSPGLSTPIKDYVCAYPHCI